MAVIVLLSGGMDSTVALYWAAKTFHSSEIWGLFFDYHQIAFDAELAAAARVWGRANAKYDNLKFLDHVHLSPLTNVFASDSSIVGRVEVNQYKDVQEAVAKTSSDKAYMPLRNVVFTSIAAHHLLVKSPQGGYIVLGVRARPDGKGGYPDCTIEFAAAMTDALSQASGFPVNVVTPLNNFAPSRTKTIQLAQTLPGCFEALEVTTSCFKATVEKNALATVCGACLPCLRRAQAFEELGLQDPALKGQP